MNQIIYPGRHVTRSIERAGLLRLEIHYARQIETKIESAIFFGVKVPRHQGLRSGWTTVRSPPTIRSTTPLRALPVPTVTIVMVRLSTFFTALVPAS
ncbi:MAG: hypothetical protein Q8L22_20145, partial [Reyranella sp.]|nr:hypothetical protein [Reyranella sp.]